VDKEHNAAIDKMMVSFDMIEWPDVWMTKQNKIIRNTYMQFMTINNRTQFMNAKDVTNARIDNNFKMRRPRLEITSTANLLVLGYRL